MMTTHSSPDVTSPMLTVCDHCSMNTHCRDRNNHRTRNMLHNLIAIQNHLHATELVVQVFPTGSKTGIQRAYPLPLECPRTFYYGAMKIRLQEIARHRDKNVFYAVAETQTSLLDLAHLVGTDGWELAEDVPFLTEV